MHTLTEDRFCVSEKKPEIVIVGAGAMGVVTGYHLSLGGANIQYLVRPGRLREIPSVYRLYSYDDSEIHSFGGFEFTANVAEIAVREPEFVLVTLDGASLASEEGQALLTGIGDAIRASNAVLIIGSIGIGLREIAISASGLPENRVVGGKIALLAHKSKGVSLPVHAPTDPNKLALSDFAYRHLNEAGFTIDDRNPSTAARFVDIFDRCGIAKCFVVSPEEFDVQSRGIMPIFIASEILNWPSADVFTGHPLWSVTVEAVREIQRLGEHGKAGEAAAASLTSESLAGLWKYLDAAAMPLDWQAFNAYHHGSKVNRADILLLRTGVERGESEGRDMRAVKELLEKVEKRTDFVPSMVSE